MITLFLFIGVSRISDTKYLYSLNLFSEDENIELPGKNVYVNNNEHYVVLTALNDFFHMLNDKKTKIKIVCCCNNNEAVFEWEKEYKVDKKFADSTKDKNLWQEIVKQIENSNIELILKGTDSIFEKLCK